MKTIRVFTSIILMTTFYMADLKAQELHTHSNAASIANESNSVSGWGGSATRTAVSSESYSGSYGIELEAPSNGWFYSSYSFNSTQDEQYVIQIYAKSNSPEDPRIYWSGVVENQSTPIIGNNWTLYSKTVTATGGTINVNVYPGTPAVTGNKAYIDHVSIVPLGNLDTQPPAPPTLLSTGNTQTTADLSWSGATDNTDVTGYKIFKDGVLEETLLDVSTYQVTGLTAGTTYSFTATALDAVANESTVSNAVPVTTSSGDTQAPTAPALLSSANSETTVDLSWSGATDNTAVTGYKIFKDGVLEETLLDISSYQVTGLTASTVYNFTVTALDAVNNESVASNIVPVTTNASSGGGGSVWSESNSVANYTGDVAIGTSTVPSGYKLAVHGKIISEELKVQLQAQWPDYVFAENYDLPSLEEVQKHIKENGHLINIPSAKEVEANGLEVGEMNRLLLEKIEELTLYMLVQQKKIKQMEIKLNGLINQPKPQR